MLPSHILNALNGTIKLANEVIQAPTQSPIQAKYHALQSTYTPTIETFNNSISAIESADYEFNAHEFNEGESIQLSLD